MTENTFCYNYSAKDNAEVLAIRKKYLPQSESKLEELKRLDGKVQTSGIAEALCVGVGSTLIFGVGLCFAMQVVGMGVMLRILGVFIGIAGMAGMLAAYPVYRKVFTATKEKYAPRILALAEELEK